MPQERLEWRIFLASAPDQMLRVWLDQEIYAALYGADPDAWGALLEHLHNHEAA